MKKRTIFLQAISLIWLYLFVSGFLQAKPLIVGFHDWAPNQMLTANNAAAGVDIDLTAAIFAEAKIAIEFRHYPWKRILYLLEHGGVDVAMSAAFTDERSEFAWFSGEVYRVGQNAMFIRKEDVAKFEDVRSLQDLQMLDVKLGVNLGISYSDEYDKLLENRAFVRLLNIYENDQTKFELLALNRLDAILAGTDIARSTIKRLGRQDDIVQHMALYPREEGETWLMYSKKTASQDVVRQVDEAIKTLRASGALDRMAVNSIHY